MGTQDSPGGLDARLDAVGHPVRRELLYEVRATLQDDAVVGLTIPVDEDDTRELALRHRHLPKLAAYEFITVEDERIEPGPRFDNIVPLLDHLEERYAADSTDPGAVEPL